MRKKPMLVVGLGNPGSKYQDTRHNVGFMVADELAHRYGVTFKTHRWNAELAEAMEGGGKIYLLKPTTYMNRSGQSVGPAVKFFKLTADRVLVIHDDLDMAPGRIKLVRGGGAGGHNGIRSLVEHLGDSSFYRLKIGIGRPGKGDVHSDYPVDQYVLGRFDQAERSLLESRFDSFSSGVELCQNGDWDQAMNLLNCLK